MAGIQEFINSDVGVALTGVLAGALLSSIGWLIKLRIDRRRDRLVFVRARSENRKIGYDKMMAAANALHFIKADSYLRGGAEPSDYDKLATRASALVEDAAADVRSNLAATEPFEKVAGYFLWLFSEDHPPMMTPGVDEFDRLRDLLVKCERVALESEKKSVLRPDHSLAENHEQKSLFEAANQRFIDQNGNVILSMGGDELADWLQGYPQERERWSASRDLSWVQMQRSSLLEDDLPPRP